jgi:hypothetical protein
MVLQKGGNIGRHGECGEIVAVTVVMRKKWSDMLPCRMIRHGGTGKE